ncbi:hypothetical protein VTN49DRAFT_7921 [Thermomyces lanuginosus]|uniref:uncharacterized protein n=1 Tax=Thermomyces lanuginosus TaxID=5541 RepID=UPI003743B7A1
MAYTADAVRAKLSALNETQEGIVTVAQWVMFHRRHAERTVQLWFEKLRESPSNKRLNLIYLANEVAQQSKARRKDDFLNAFSPIIAEAMAIAYKGASNEIQQKLRRVVEVWRQRMIFEQPIQRVIEARIEELDKNRSSGKKPLLGGSLFSGSSGTVPTELQPLVPLQTALTKASVSSTTAVTTANAEYDRMNDPNTPAPTPPVHAARLTQLLKSLANAENSVSEVIKSRQALVDALEKMLNDNRAALDKERSLVAQLAERKVETETKKRDVEFAIMQGLAAEDSQYNAQAEGAEASRPQVEALTPPPVESLTPVGSPKAEPASMPASAPPETAPAPAPQSQPQPFSLEPDSPVLEGGGLPGLSTTLASPPPAADNAPSNGVAGGSAKRRKVAHGDEEYAQYATGELDADVAELLKQEGE